MGGAKLEQCTHITNHKPFSENRGKKRKQYKIETNKLQKEEEENYNEQTNKQTKAS